MSPVQITRPRRPAVLLGPAAVVLVVVLLSLAPARPCRASPEAEGIPARGQTSGGQQHRVAQDLESAIARVQPLLARYGYPAVFLGIMVEGVGVPAPGQTFLMAAAYEAAQGKLSIVWVLFWAFTAAVAGNSLGYLLGRWGGRPLLGRLRVNEQRLARLEDYFTRRGKWVVVIARFVDGLRQINGIAAGMLKMPWKVFTVVNTLGAALWTGVWGLGVYFLDKKIVSLHLTLHQVKPWVAGFGLLAFLALVGHLLWPGRKKPVGGGPGN
jgi:membrane protein DedA with SNARE-associated domain